MATKPDKILIVAGDTDGNLGDRAIVLSMCAALKGLRPDIELAITSADPASAREFFRGIQIILRGPRGLVALMKCAWASDLILCGGGGLFQDDDSLAKMPYWAMRLVFLRLFCRRIVGYSLGVGPLTSRSGRGWARVALSCMTRITVRDERALNTCRALTSKSITVLPDPALVTPPAAPAEALAVLRAKGLPQGDAPIIGVALRRWFHNPDKTWIPHKYAYKYRLRSIPERSEYQRLIALLAKVLDDLVASYNAYVLCMPTYNVSHESDDETCRQVLEKMHTGRAAMVEIRDPRLYKTVAGQLAVMLGGRMHPTILAASAGTPIVGLSYNPKFSGFFALLGMVDRVIDIEAFVKHEMTGALYSLLAQAIEGKGGYGDQRLRELGEVIWSFNESLLSGTAA
ncbi:MAG: polysaccharide pyruvyl transferase family protein [Gammaproteobacteria bacterium]